MLMKFVLLYGCVLCCLLFSATVSLADDPPERGTLSLHFSPYVIHYEHNPEHNSFPWFTNIEWESSSRWDIGGAVFRNSFYQPCGYIYGGKRWTFGPSDQHLYFKLTAGALIGYFKPYDNKIPLNADGIALGIIPVIGYKYHRASTQLVVLGTAGVMFTIGYDIWN